MTEGRLRPPDPPRRRVTPLDIVILVAVAAVAVFLVYRVEAELAYRWDWDRFFDYVVGFDEETGAPFANLILQGLFMTLRLAFWGTLAAAAIGIVMGLCRTSANLFLRMMSRLYVETIRNLPPLIILIVFYFFLSSQIMPLLGLGSLAREASPETAAVITWLFAPPPLLENFVAGVIVLALFEAAYITEIVRAGIQSIPKGQWEAARAVGLSRYRVQRDVVLPQAIRRILPPLAGQFITLVKDSAIVSLISIQELTFMTHEVANTTTNFFEPWLFTGFLYFLVCFPLALLFRRLERRMQAGDR